eukprot:7126178-Lingulodinium_polyedra.AAC.1
MPRRLNACGRCDRPVGQTHAWLCSCYACRLRQTMEDAAWYRKPRKLNARGRGCWTRGLVN